MENNIITLKKLEELDLIPVVIEYFKTLEIESISSDEYCLNKEYYHRENIITNFNLKPETLEKLTKDIVTLIEEDEYESDANYCEDLDVLYSIIDNKNTSDKTLIFLSETFDDSGSDEIKFNVEYALENRGYVKKTVWVKE